LKKTVFFVFGDKYLQIFIQVKLFTSCYIKKATCKKVAFLLLILFQNKNLVFILGIFGMAGKARPSSRRLRRRTAIAVN
jgi:hypothetical protein